MADQVVHLVLVPMVLQVDQAVADQIKISPAQLADQEPQDRVIRGLQPAAHCHHLYRVVVAEQVRLPADQLVVLD